MTIEKQTVPYCLNVVWDETGKLKGAAYYEQDVIRDDGVIISVKQGDAQPVAVLDHKGVDVAGIIGRIGQDAIALAESKDAELRAAQADVQRLTGERDGIQSRVAALDAEANALRAEIEAMKAPKPIMREQLAVYQTTKDDNGVPQRVPMADAQIVLLRAGLLQKVQDALDAMPSPEGDEARIRWAKDQYIRRDNPLVVSVQGALGMTDADIDALFVAAAKL